MKKSLYSTLALLSLVCSMGLYGMNSKQEADRTVIKNLINDIKRAQQDFDEKKAQAIKETAEAIIPNLKNLDDEEKVIALSEIDELMRFFKPVVKQSKQEERKKEVAAMPAAPGGPRMVKPSEEEMKKEAEPKKVIKQKPMSDAAKKRRRFAQENQRYYREIVGTDISKIRGSLTEKVRVQLDSDLYLGLTNGLDRSIIINILEKGANPNAYYLSRSKNISVPAFWGLINAVQEGRYYMEDDMRGLLIGLHRYGANLDLKASDGTPILHYVFKYWPKLENQKFDNLELLPPLLELLMTYGVDLNAVDANGDTFLDVLLKRVDDPFLTGRGKEILNFIMDNINVDTQKSELRDMVEEYKREHIQPARQAIKRPAPGEAIPQPGIRNIMAEYLFGEEPAAKK